MLQRAILYAALIIALITVNWAQGAASPDFDAAADAYRAQNFIAARAGFLKLAGAGDVRSKAILGMMSRFGEGVPVDLPEAFNWYLDAARSGHPPAQYQVGRMLSLGEGVAINERRAQHWFGQAAEQGYEKAIDQLTQQTLEQPQITELKPISRVWNFQLPNNFKPDETPILNNHQLPVIRVQLGAMKTKDAAIDLWTLIQDELPSLTRDLPFTVSHYVEPKQNSIFRLRIGEFQSTADAGFFCEQVKKVSRRPCWVINDPSQ